VGAWITTGWGLVLVVVEEDPEEVVDPIRLRRSDKDSVIELPLLSDAS
jgi:hypothetical protein